MRNERDDCLNMELEGRVKSYSAKNGFGFITDINEFPDTDIYFGRKDLPGQLLNQNIINTVLRFVVVKEERGGKYRATNIQDTNSQATFRSTVKTWNRQTMYGFIACPKQLLSFTNNPNGKNDILFGNKNLVDTSVIEKVQGNLLNRECLFSVNSTEKGLAAIYVRFPDLEDGPGSNNGPNQNDRNNDRSNYIQQDRHNNDNMSNNTHNNLKRDRDDGYHRNDRDRDEKRRRTNEPQVVPDGRHLGFIRSYVNGKYGFITCYDPSVTRESVFYLGGRNGNYKSGQVLEFEFEKDTSAEKPRASNVTFLPHAPNAVENREEFETWAKSYSTCHDEQNLNSDGQRESENQNEENYSEAYENTIQYLEMCSEKEILKIQKHVNAKVRAMA